jgi:AraC family transcriptional regulator
VDYEVRLQRVIAYIHDHIEEDIDLDRLADIACLSSWHWHRIYRSIQGETIAATIRRLRLHHAAGRLAHTDMAIEEIARRAHYGSVHAFTRAFTSAYGLPPASYRTNGSHAAFKNAKGPKSMSDYSVEIRTMQPAILGAVLHKGPYIEIGKAFELAGAWFASRNLLKPETRMIGVYYDDPCALPEGELRSYAGFTVDEDFVFEPPIEKVELKGGEHAVLLVKGPYTDLMPAYQWFYGEWLPHSGREPADCPPFEDYLNTPQDTVPNDLLTEIHMPLR